MRIHLELFGVVIEYKRTPMEPERFTALCKLALAAIGGVVLLGVIALVGFWAIPWSVGALALYGIYRGIQSI